MFSVVFDVEIHTTKSKRTPLLFCAILPGAPQLVLTAEKFRNELMHDAMILLRSSIFFS